LAAAAADSSRAASSTFGTLQPGVYLDASGNFFVIDATTTNTRERKITAAGVVSTVTSVSAVYGSVQGSAILAPNNIYTTYQNCVVHDLLLTSAGSEYVSGSADGAATTKARFDFPSGIVGDKTGTLFVADTGNNEIRKITPAGVVSTLAGAPVSGDWVDGVGAAARFNQPQALAIDSVGNVYVVEQTNRTIRKVTPAGVVSTFASPCGAGCPTGSVCQGNACVACTGGLAACGGIACLDLQNDDGNCGACGHACTTGNAYMCSAGKCTGSTIDMDFGASTTKKTGVAWTGFPADVWNAVNTAALPPDLVLAWNDGTPATGVSVTATNLQGAWGWAGEKPVDPMYANYNYSWGGDSADVALHGLPDGRYAAVVFGKQGKNNTGFYVTVEDASGGVLLTTATSYTSTDADTAKYTDENQLVVFAWMDVHAGQTLRFHLLPGAQGDGNAGMILNGLQLVREHL
ncbi:MAG TPA: hypothetical protein VIF62_31545, partial [Labilithrix sp.]